MGPLLKYAALSLSFLCVVVNAEAQSWASRAQTAAADLNEICQRDGGRLWGVSLCGPLIIVDPTTREIWANQADANGVLQPTGAGWSGVMPNDVAIANTSTTWSGVQWIMLIGVPESAVDRRVLVAHEAWHRVQVGLGFNFSRVDNAHLATEQGRTLLRLEMRALASALRSRGSGQRRAIRDALAFRQARHDLFPAAASEEAALERNEGLAAYTGAKLGAADDAEVFAAATLDRFDTHQAYSRAYAYAVGPAYGLLLDSTRRAGQWRRTIGQAAPADLLAAATRFVRYTEAELAEAAGRYDGLSVTAQERTRAEEQAARIAEYRRVFSGPRLELALTNPRIMFNPNQITPVEGLGSVYGTLTVGDAWGEVRVTEAGLINPEFNRVTVANPAPDGRSGPGWTLSLSPGYRLSPPDASGARRIEAERRP